MSINQTIGQLVRAFNIVTTQYIVTNSNQFSGKINQTSTVDKALYNSSLGTPVFANLTFMGGMYIDFHGNLVQFNDLTFDCVLMTVNQPKRIITTEIQGRDGSVKEYIGMDDYHVTINGIINGPNGHFPVDEVNTLHQVMKAAIAVDVASTYLQNLDIHTLVVKEFTYDQEPGGFSKQNFTITCISDAPVALVF